MILSDRMEDIIIGVLLDLYLIFKKILVQNNFGFIITLTQDPHISRVRCPTGPHSQREALSLPPSAGGGSRGAVSFYSWAACFLGSLVGRGEDGKICYRRII